MVPDRPGPAVPPRPEPVKVFWKCNLGYYIVVWVYQGVTRVHFEDEVVSLHVGQAVWVPPRLAHRVEHDGTSVALAILIPDRGSHSLGGHRVFINVPPSHTQWMFHLMLLTLSPLHTGQLPASRIVDLLAHFATGEPPGRPTAELLLPHHPAARQVAAIVLADPFHAPPLVESARRLQVSERTLRRAFAEQTGMGFRQWKAAARQAVQLRGQPMPYPAGTCASTACRPASSSWYPTATPFGWYRIGVNALLASRPGHRPSRHR